MGCINIDNIELSTYIGDIHKPIQFNKPVLFRVYNIEYDLLDIKYSDRYDITTNNLVYFIVWYYNECRYGIIYVGDGNGSA